MRDFHWELARLAGLIDPADDGAEVDIIRTEMCVAAGHNLHWADRKGRVLCPPMSTAEACEKGIEL